MAKITISELRPAGADLFEGSESFMHELSEQEITDVLGGAVVITWTFVCWGLKDV
ncbi:MAG: hypothetical protein MJK14_06450 [Rivularia sp. ALOHA_DT_140]|nr:hypothetical protein [Rivularia sp. ALOHA_DT_140]